MAKRRRKTKARASQKLLPMGYSAGGVVIPRTITETQFIERLIPIANISIANSNDAVLNASNDAIQQISNSGNSSSDLSNIGNPTIGPVTGGSASIGDVAGGSASSNSIGSVVLKKSRNKAVLYNNEKTNETNSRVPFESESSGNNYREFVDTARDISDSGASTGASSAQASTTGGGTANVVPTLPAAPTVPNPIASIFSAIGVPSYALAAARRAGLLTAPAVAGLLTAGQSNALLPIIVGTETAMFNHAMTNNMIETPAQAAHEERMAEQEKIAEILEDRNYGGGGSTNGGGIGRHGSTAVPEDIPLTDSQEQYLLEGMDMLGHFTPEIAQWYGETRQEGYSPYDAIAMAAEVKYREAGGSGYLFSKKDSSKINAFIDENVSATTFPDLETFDRYITPAKAE